MHRHTLHNQLSLLISPLAFFDVNTRSVSKNRKCSG